MTGPGSRNPEAGRLEQDKASHGSRIKIQGAALKVIGPRFT